MNKKRFNLFNSVAFSLIFLVLLNVLGTYIIYSISDYTGVQKQIFLTVIVGAVALILILNFVFLLGYVLKRKLARKCFTIISIFVVLIFGFTSYYITRLRMGIGNLIVDTDNEDVEYSLVVLDESINIATINEDIIFGYVSGDEIYESAVNKQISSHSSLSEIRSFDSYQDLLTEFLIQESIDIAILPKQYVRYAESLGNEAETKLLSAHSLETFNIKVDGSGGSNVKVLEEPFSILMMGLNDNLADSIILATINPKTLNVTMTSIARDLYVPIACYANNSFDKLNHARGRSRNCIVGTIEDLLDIEIDFFFETDFYAVVKIVDALGGLNIESPITFEGSFPVENSNKYEQVQVPIGKNLLNGKQVLTFARERHHFVSGDFQRQLNQQYVIKEIANKIIAESKKNINTLLSVIEAAEDNIIMNLSIQNDISPLLGLALSNITASSVDAMHTFKIVSNQIYGDTPRINGKSVIVPYKQSVEDVKALIHENLSLDARRAETVEVSYSINHPYVSNKVRNQWKYINTPLMYPNQYNPEQETDNDSKTPTNTSHVVPDFTQMSVEEVKAWGDTHNVTIRVVTIGPSHGSYNDHYEEGQIIYQSKEATSYNVLPEIISISVIRKESVATIPSVPVFETLSNARAFASTHGLRVMEQCNYSQCSELIESNPDSGKVLRVNEAFTVVLKEKAE